MNVLNVTAFMMRDRPCAPADCEPEADVVDRHAAIAAFSAVCSVLAVLVHLDEFGGECGHCCDPCGLQCSCRSGAFG